MSTKMCLPTTKRKMNMYVSIILTKIYSDKAAMTCAIGFLPKHRPDEAVSSTSVYVPTTKKLDTLITELHGQKKLRTLKPRWGGNFFISVPQMIKMLYDLKNPVGAMFW